MRRFLLFLTVLLTVACDRKAHKFQLSLVQGQDVGFSKGAPLDQDFRSLVSYYEPPECQPAAGAAAKEETPSFFVPVVSIERADSDTNGKTTIPLFFSSPLQFELREKLKLDLMANAVKDQYSSTIPALVTFDAMVGPSKQVVDFGVLEAKHPDALKLIVRDGAVQDRDAARGVRTAIGVGLCKGVRTFSVILRSPPPPVPVDPGDLEGADKLLTEFYREALPK